MGKIHYVPLMYVTKQSNTNSEIIYLFPYVRCFNMEFIHCEILFIPINTPDHVAIGTFLLLSAMEIVPIITVYRQVTTISDICKHNKNEHVDQKKNNNPYITQNGMKINVLGKEHENT